MSNTFSYKQVWTDDFQKANWAMPVYPVIADLQFRDAPMLDALEREAVAQTRIIGREFRLLIQAGLSEREFSISLYHEILEAATVGVPVHAVRQ